MPDDGCISRADLESLIGIAEVRLMLSRGRRRPVAKSYAARVTHWPGFPEPLITYPRDQSGPRPYTRVRLWLPADVEDFCRRTIPGWDHLPPAPMD